MVPTWSEQVVNIAPGEGQVPMSHYAENNWEALAFPREYSHVLIILVHLEKFL